MRSSGEPRFYLLDRTIFSPDTGDGFLIICVTADGPTPDAPCEEHFGRAPFFLIMDMDSGEWRVVENRFPGPCGGKVPGAVRILVEQGATILITGRIGGTGQAALEEAGIRVFRSPEGIRVGEALRRFRRDELVRIA